MQIEAECDGILGFWKIVLLETSFDGF